MFPYANLGRSLDRKALQAFQDWEFANGQEPAAPGTSILWLGAVETGWDKLQSGKPDLETGLIRQHIKHAGGVVLPITS